MRFLTSQVRFAKRGQNLSVLVAFFYIWASIFCWNGPI
uniref:Uncharacterized protein n=1 Tax=Pseudomonas putida TaxID=303 RepID=A0A6B7PWP9_PSEPU|nr:hypothetical protein [Pseudomonas putida]